MRREPARVLVIDDSAFSRQTITRMLRSSPLVEVVGVARDGEEALRKVYELEPDLITLDLEMPKMDGFTFLRLVMSRQPTPVIVISGRAAQDDVFRALELGAVEFVAKPTPHATPDLVRIEDELIRKVHAMRELRIEKVTGHIEATPLAIPRPGATRGPRIVAIGCSTGGPTALLRILSAFPEPPPFGFLIAQHMPAGFTQGLAERLDRLTPFSVVEARGGERPRPGTAFVSPGGCHLELESAQGHVVTRIVATEPTHKYVPSVDRLFESAAKHYGPDLLAVVLTGMGDDGRRGLVEVKKRGGSVIAESEETAVIFGMPQQAVRSGAVDRVLPLHQIPAALQSGIEPAEARDSS